MKEAKRKQFERKQEIKKGKINEGGLVSVIFNLIGIIFILSFSFKRSISRGADGVMSMICRIRQLTKFVDSSPLKFSHILWCYTYNRMCFITNHEAFIGLNRNKLYCIVLY